MTETRQTPCTVCQLLDKDSSTKETVYCKICDANMCQRCYYHIGRRAAAMLVRGLKGGEDDGGA